MTRVYAELVDFIARGAELVAGQKAGDLSPDEAAELDHFLHVEHLMRLAKAGGRRAELGR